MKGKSNGSRERLRGFIASHRRVRHEALGLNRRNLEVLQGYNDGRLYRIADDKWATKEALRWRGLPVPGDYAVCRGGRGRRAFEAAMLERDDYVLKPARGTGGEGVMVVTGRKGDRLRLSGGTLIRPAALLAHLGDILAGAFAISQSRDDALLEERLRSAPEWAEISPWGVADVRVLLFRGVPLQAMLRLPGSRSRGRANLHAGGIGVGIDLCTGLTLGAIRRDRPLASHPETGESFAGRPIPAWRKTLEVATAAYDALPLGYVGVDVIVDAERGPVILELNARPGLSIQLASGRGLRPLLAAVAALPGIEQRPVMERVEAGKRVTKGRVRPAR